MWQLRQKIVIKTALKEGVKYGSDKGEENKSTGNDEEIKTGDIKEKGTR